MENGTVIIEGREYRLDWKARVYRSDEGIMTFEEYDRLIVKDLVERSRHGAARRIFIQPKR